MTTDELNTIVAAVVAELEKSGVDFDYKAEQAKDDDLVFVIRGTAPNYQGVTVTWKGLLDIITAQATQAKNDAETAKNTANTILEQVQSKGTEITNFVATSKAEIETQKNEAVETVRSVYQTDLNELKGDLVNYRNSIVNSYADIKWAENKAITRTGTVRDLSGVYASDFIPVFKGEKITVNCIAPGVADVNCIYDTDKKFVSYFETNQYNIPYFMVIEYDGYIRLSNEAYVIPNSNCYVKRDMSFDVIENNVAYVANDSFKFSITEFENGSLASGGVNDSYRSASRVRPKAKISYKSDVTIVPNGAYMYLFIWETETPTEIYWTNEPYTINANTEFRLILSPSETYTDTITVYDMVEKFDLYFPIHKKVDNLSNEVVDLENKVGMIPSYYFDDNYIDNKISDIEEKATKSENTLSFAYITDVHTKDNAGNSIKLISYLANNTPFVPFTIFGGDVISTQGTGKHDVIDSAMTWQKWMSYIDKSKVFQVRGNHDYMCVDSSDSSVEYTLSNAEVKNFLTNNISSFVNVPVGKTYYYVDLPSFNARIIVLDVYEKTYGGLTQEQADWIINDALNCSNKNIIFAMHQTVDSAIIGSSRVFAPIHALMKALKNKEVLNWTDWTTFNHDFTNDTNTFVCNITGHYHKDENTLTDDVLTIMTNCDAMYGDLSGLTRTIGTISEQSFDIMSFDFINRKIYCTRIGAGSDREFSY